MFRCRRRELATLFRKKQRGVDEGDTAGGGGDGRAAAGRIERATGTAKTGANPIRKMVVALWAALCRAWVGDPDLAAWRAAAATRHHLCDDLGVAGDFCCCGVWCPDGRTTRRCRHRHSRGRLYYHQFCVVGRRADGAGRAVVARAAACHRHRRLRCWFALHKEAIVWACVASVAGSGGFCGSGKFVARIL